MNSLVDSQLLQVFLRHILVALSREQVNLTLIMFSTKLYCICHFSGSRSAMALARIWNFLPRIPYTDVTRGVKLAFYKRTNLQETDGFSLHPH